jgi:3,4-dihydroxyphenylacetate 2,3-dioxygenase
MTQPRKKGRLTGVVVPHSPTILEDAARNRKNHVIDALKVLKKELAKGAPDLILSVSPFWVPKKGFFVDGAPHHKTLTDHHGYATPHHYDAPGDLEFSKQLIAAAKERGLPVSNKKYGADHSTCVPAMFLFPEKHLPLVPLSATEDSLEKCLEWGKCIREVVEASGRNAVLLCGGGLSYNLTACLHYEDCMAAIIFDQYVLNYLKKGEATSVKNIDRYWIEHGNPPAKFRDLFVFLGAIGEEKKAELLAYEGAPGVGWAVMRFS